MKMPKILFILFLSSFIYAQNSEIKKVFHHKNDSMGIEVAKLSFYFSSKPTIEVMPEVKDEKKLKAIYLLPRTIVQSDKIKQALDKLSNESQNNYQITVTQKPTQDVQIEIAYDPEEIMIEFETYKSISRQEGLVFRFYNKKLLKRLEDLETSVLTTACDCHQKIIIDPGHGGRDCGALGCGIKEKDICLDISKEVAEQLKKKDFRSI